MQQQNHLSPPSQCANQGALPAARKSQHHHGYHPYFGRGFGVMVLMDSISSQALSVREVKHETNALHAEALNDLREKGIAIQGIVCDGRKGLLQLFPEIPAQLCQFHQVKTVSRYLTRNPKTAAGKALWQLAPTLKDSGKVAFQSALQAWFERHQGFLNEPDGQ